MKTNKQHTAKGRKVFSDTRNTDRPFVPPRLIVPETQPMEDDSGKKHSFLKTSHSLWTKETERNKDRLSECDSEGETQLPKDQPPYIPETTDFVPVASIFLDERRLEDEDMLET